MKVYVATKFERKDEARRAQALLRTAGHEITHDWTKEDAEGKTGAVLDQYLQSCAEADVVGAGYAGAILMIHDDNGRGMFVEMGVVLGVNLAMQWYDPRPKFLRVLVVNGKKALVNWKAPIFYKLPEVEHYDSVEAAVAALTEKTNAPATVS